MFQLKSMLFALAVTFGLVGTAPMIAHAKQGDTFTSADLSGDWGFRFEGVVLAGGSPVPIAAHGQLFFDGQGVVTDAVRTLNFGGTVLHQTSVGTYVVHPDGTGEAEFEVTTVDPPGALPVSMESFEFVLTDNQRSLQFISTTPGVVADGEANRQ